MGTDTGAKVLTSTDSTAPPDIAAKPAPGRGASRRELVVVGVAVSVYAAFVALRYLPRGRLGAGFDRLAYTAPNHAAAFEALRAGHLPQWNSYLFGGAPLLANPQVGALYPLKYPFLWMAPQRGVTALLAVHLVLMGIGMVLLLGVGLRLRWPAVLVGSVVLLSSGVVISQLPHYEQLTTIAWAPWLLLAVDLVTTRRLRWAVGLSAVALPVAMMLLCGHQQPAYYLLLLAMAWGLGRALDDRSPRAFATVVAGTVAGFGLAAAQLLPTALLVGRSVRSGGLDLAAVSTPDFMLRPGQLVSAFLGDPLSYSAPVGIEVYAAIGAAAMFLALCGAIAGVRSQKARWLTAALAASTVGGALLAMGVYTPVYRVAFHLLPGLDLFRVPGRAVVIVDIALAVLAAMGLEAVLRTERAAVAVGACAFAAIGIIAVVMPQTLVGGRTVLLWGLAGGAMVSLALTLPGSDGRARRALVVAIIAVPITELALSAYQVAPSDALPSTESTGRLASYLRDDGGRALIAGIDDFGNQSYLRVSMRPNVNAIERVRSLDGYDGGAVLTRRWTQAMEAITGRPFVNDLTLKAQLPPVIDPQLLARFGVKWFAADRRTIDADVALAGWEGPVIKDGPLALFRNPAFRSEALVYRAVEPDDGSPLYEQLPASDEYFETALIEGGAPVSCAGGCSVEPAELERPRPGRLIAATDGTPGMLVVAEGWDPGWSVRVDGQLRPVRIADRNLLAVRLAPGDRRAVFTYAAPGLRVGVALSSLTVFLLSATFLVARWRRAPRKTRVTTSAASKE